MKFSFQKVEQINNHSFDLVQVNQKKNILFKSYYDKISKKKEEIDNDEISKYWDKMKKIGNPYELIYTSYNKKRKNDSISVYSPISRSYFKLWEIFYNFDIFKYSKKNDVFHCTHLAEGPGGFMEASINYSNKMKKKNSYFWGLTLKPNDEYVPDWNKIKKICKNEKNAVIEYGDLYEYEDVFNFIFNLRFQNMDLVTADGGFDYSSNFNGQELNSCQIIYSEIVVALNILKKNGCFVIKMFDLFSLTSIQCLQLLVENFEEVVIFKPETSRQANSEKYIICLYYKDILNDTNKEKLLLNIKKWNELPKDDDNYVMLDIKINNSIVHDINKFNNNFVDNQVQYIDSILYLINNKLNKDEYHNLLKNQVFKAIEWCKKYNVKINEESIYYRKNN
jgi:23S rRNA U2552 (ribose-2'-O)-methylase RlmE/FtsJ